MAAYRLSCVVITLVFRLQIRQWSQDYLGPRPPLLPSWKGKAHILHGNARPTAAYLQGYIYPRIPVLILLMVALYESAEADQ